MKKQLLSPRRLSALLGNLPEPNGIYSGDHATFEVYRAKDMHDPKWNGSALKEIITASRGAYSRYGKRPLFDDYDTKAAVYAVRAKYRIPGKNSFAEEWLSIRMVPGDRHPLGVAEPEIYLRKGRRMDYWMKKKIGARDFWHHVASSSRMCGIPPYATGKDGRVSFAGASRHRYTVICFALIHKQFVIDYPLARFPYRYITAMVRPDFYKTRLAYRSRGRTIHPTHIPAYRFLKIARSEIHVDRDVYSYPFPLYWLHGEKLLRLMNDLRKKNKMPALAELTPKMLSGLTQKSDRPVAIAGVRIEPSRMRELIDRFVPDMPELKITDAKRWYGGMDAVLRAAKVTQESK